MKTGREDLDALIKIQSVPAGEPVFVLRGQDAVASDAVRAWAGLAHAKGVDPAILEQALQQADRMDAWPAKKIADADHLAEHERKQLASQLSRRAWSWALEHQPTEEAALAYQLGRDSLAGRVQHMAALINAVSAALEAGHVSRAEALVAMAQDYARGEP